MKEYYFEMTNGEYDFIEARTDHSAYIKACKIAKEQYAEITYLAEQMDDEEDRVIEI